MRHLRAAAVLATAAILVAATGARAQDATFVERFDDPALPGWELDPPARVVDGTLRVVDDGFAYSAVQVDDVTITARLRRLGTGNALVFYRWGEAEKYILVITPVGMELQRSAERLTVLARTAIRPGGGWATLAITVRGGDHEVRLDGKRALRASDDDPVGPAGFGFGFDGEGRLEVDEVELRPSAAPPTASSSATATPGPAAQRWVRTGGPLGGLGYDVRMRPGGTERMYVTDALAGLFVSSDGGATWAPSNRGITTRMGESGDRIPVFCVTIDPHDPDTIWAGTQYTRGIFRSTDGGRRWVERDRGVVEQEGITFRGITVDPRSPDVVYAAAELSSWAWAGEVRNGREWDMTKGVVYRSTDGGARWKAIWRGQNLARYVWVDPRDSDVIYISTGIFDREAGNSDPATRTPGGDGVVKSTDGGQTWHRANGGLGNWYVGSLFMHPTDPDVLLAGTGNNQYREGAGVYLTTDGGATWSQTLADEVITAVEFAVSDPSIAYAAGNLAVYRSTDGARTWQLVAGPDGWGPPGIVAGFPIDFQVDPADPDRVFANNYGGGNFLSTDGGRTWAVASTGYTGAQVRAIAIDPRQPGRIYAAARSGLFRSDDGGTSWVGLANAPGNALEWDTLAVDPADGRHLVTSNNMRPHLMASRDGGATLTLATEPLPEGFGFRSLAFAPGETRTIYAGTGAYVSAGQFTDSLPARGILASTDGGATWADANDARSDDAQVADLAIDAGDARRVFAATTNHGLLRTEDGGARWTAIAAGRGATWALSVAIDPRSADHLLAGFAPGGVHRSTDGGSTWRTTTGLPAESLITDIVFDPANPRTVYASDRSSGVYRSSDGGTTWKRLTTGLAMRSTNALAVSSDGRHLYAATEGAGVYRLDLDGAPPPAAPPAALTPAPSATPTAGASLGAGAPASTPAGSPAPSGIRAPEPVPGSTPASGPATERTEGDDVVPIIVTVAAAVAAGFVAWIILRRRRAA